MVYRSDPRRAKWHERMPNFVQPTASLGTQIAGTHPG
jgi:hypothetical protein